MNPMEQLSALRARGGEQKVLGLPDATIEHFLAHDPKLGQAIAIAAKTVQEAEDQFSDLLERDEADLARDLQCDFVQFYDAETVNQYVAAGACGPWLVTSRGAVLHDSGGYGMLGQGHEPAEVLEAMSKSWVMANVMTPSFSHRRFGIALKNEVGHTRGQCPYERIICMNSGSESVSVAARIADSNAFAMTRPGARYQGRPAQLMSMRGGFHGRTTRPAQASDSCLPKYRQHLLSFERYPGPILVEPNDIAALEAGFAEAEANGVFIELLLIEPVMGEGNPGRAITRAFYDRARELTHAHGSLLLLDSIQAGLRATGCLSIVDYPGFEDCDVPDMETWSKALNAGQYPLSVLGMNRRAAQAYARGIYGNTMTTNPRALEVGTAVLRSITPEMRQNIRERGVEFVQKLEALALELPGTITNVQGTGLLLAAELNPAIFKVVASDGVESYCRTHGIGVIHGGSNALRFTPHFNITSDEIDMIVRVVRQALVALSSNQPALTAGSGGQ